MNIKQQIEAALKAAGEVVETAKAAGRELTGDEADTVEAKLAEVADLKSKQANLERGKSLTDQLAKMAPADDDAKPGRPAGDPAEQQAKSLGEHFVKHAHDRLLETKGSAGAAVAAPEFKAATDTHTVNDWTEGTPVLTDVDRTIVSDYRPPLVVADLLGSGAITGNAISYFVEGEMEGQFENVAEAANKPQMHFTNPTSQVDALRKMAGFIDLSDEFLEDVPFLVSEINNRLIYELRSHEQAQLLHGDGQGQNILGLLARDIQEHAATGGTEVEQADAVFHANTMIQTTTGMTADGIVINPADYERFRLGRDENGQYYGGGYLAGQYGNGGIAAGPALWGMRTVVTPWIEKGTVLVGAFRQAATVYRKGGIRIESTNSDASKFTSNIVTIRAEQRLALAVRRPQAIVKVDLGDASGEA